MSNVDIANVVRLAQDDDRRRSGSEQNILQVLKDCEALLANGRRPYVSLRIEDHWETYPIEGEAALDRLGHFYFRRHGSPLRKSDRERVQQMLRAQAMDSEHQRDLPVRIGSLDNRVFIDLGERQWRAVEISPEQVRVIGDPPLRFLRSRGMLCLPQPDLSGDIAELRSLLPNVDDANWVLLLGAVLASLNPRGPYLIIVIEGPHGAGKTWLVKTIRRLIDPSTSSTRTLPRRLEDLWISAQQEWMISFDNISDLTDAQSDELCRLASGGGSATRQHYTNTEQVLFDACRPIFLNGIAPGITRPDLVDRCIFIRLTRTSMRSERELEAAFNGIYAKVFGALCRGIQSALRHTETATVNPGVRMLDAVRWVTAGEAALGLRSGSFAEAYEQNAREAVEHLIENDPFANAVLVLVRTCGQWQGSATELLFQLEPFAPRTGRAATRWPASVQQLSARLQRLEPLLAQVGLSIDRDRETNTNRDRFMRLTDARDGER